MTAPSIGFYCDLASSSNSVPPIHCPILSFWNGRRIGRVKVRKFMGKDINKDILIRNVKASCTNKAK